MIIFSSEQIKNMLENKMQHSYIEKYFEKPFIDLDKITALGYILNHIKTPEQRKMNVIISVMLVQIALDTHEKVPNNNFTEKDDLIRQLSILAGDYYSGLYYYILAELNEIPLIQSIAKAIKNINEKKMILYNEEASNWEELLYIYREIETSLFYEVSNCVELPLNNLHFVEEILFLNRLLREIKTIQNGEFSFVAHYVNNKIININQRSIIAALYDEVEKSRLRINRLSQDLPYEFIRLKNIIFDNKTLSAVEEG